MHYEIAPDVLPYREHIKEAVAIMEKYGYELVSSFRVEMGTRRMVKSAARASWEGFQWEGRIRIDRMWISLSPHFVFQATDEEFVDTMLHELAHIYRFQEGDLYGHHDHHFKEMAEVVGFSLHCEEFVEPRYVVHCSQCHLEWPRAVRSSLVKQPHKHMCPNCDIPLVLK